MDGSINKPATYESDGAQYCERLGLRCLGEIDGSAACEHCGHIHPRVAFRPHGQRILVMLDRKQTHYGSIEIPDYQYARRQPQKGTCVAVGRLINRDGSVTGLEIKLGERVCFGKFNGVQIDAPDGFDPKRTFYLLRVDPDLRFEGDARVHMDEVLGIVESEDDVMRVPD